jgi:hypothetical protein
MYDYQQQQQQPGQPYPGQQQHAPHQKPGKVQAIAIMALVDGILNVLWGLFLLLIFGIPLALTLVGLCVVPFLAYPLVVGVMGIIYGSKMLQERPAGAQPNKVLAIMQIVNILLGNVVSLVVGIISLVFYNEDEVQAYYRSLNG